MVVNWTNEQKQAIEDRGHNLLVSASAGSGKTTVMIERIFRLIREDHIPITNFLILTFTKASASDMKKKLSEKLEEFSDDDFIASQIENMATADISNLHSFCSRIISTYFYEVNIDPAYKIIDEGEAAFLREKALKLLFEEKEKTGDEEFFTLFEIFQKKRSNKNLKDIIVRFNNFLNTNLDSDKFLIDTTESAYSLDLKNNSCAKIINTYVSLQAREDAEEAENFAKECEDLGADKLAEHFYQIADKFKSIKISNSYIANAKNTNEIAFDRTPTVPKELKFLSEKIKKLKKQLKENVENYKKNFVSDDEEFLKEGLIQARKYLESLKTLTAEFDQKYSKLKLEANGLDFNDLEKYALQILQNSAINSAVKEKYKYVFVDEYQDINSVQEKIISLVSGKNNRFMVGDVKQSIYRFRLCNPDIFLEKFEEYKNSNEDSKLIKLNCNFRSDKKILKFVDSIFSKRMTENFGGLDYEKDSQFVPGENNADGEKSVNLLFIDTETEKQDEELARGVYSVKNHVLVETIEQKKAIAEATVVKEKILELVSPENPNHMKFSDIAVLVSTRNASTKKFAETLISYGIPVSKDDKNDLMSKPHILELVNYVKFLVQPNDDYVTFKALKSSMFNFSNKELAKIRLCCPKSRFFECLQNTSKIEDEDLRNKVLEFLEKTENYRKLSKVICVKPLLKKIIEDYDLENINLLKEDGEDINDDISLFLGSLPAVKASEYSRNYSDTELEIEGESGGDAVKMMTIHKSKGIEFKAVFVINLSNNFNFQSTYGSILMNKDLGIGLDYFDLKTRTESPTIAISAIRIIEKRKLVEEQQRVLYVGLTRAKEKLFVVCSKNASEISSTFGSRHRAFIEWFERDISNELEGKHNDLINFEASKIDDLLLQEKFDKKQLLLTKSDAKEPNWYEYGYSSSLGIPAKSSISKIIRLQEERDEDEEEKVIYKSGSSSAKRGTIYHKIFEKLDFFDEENASNQLDKIISSEFSEEDRQMIDKNIVLDVLKLPLFSELESADKIIKEREFFAEIPSGKILGYEGTSESVIIQGVFDLLAVKGDNMILVDYKTGKIDDEKLKKYKFQMDIYKFAAENAFQKNVSKRILVLIDEKKLLEIWKKI